MTNPEDPSATESENAEDEREIEEFWTDERMGNATPAKMPTIDPEEDEGTLGPRERSESLRGEPALPTDGTEEARSFSFSTRKVSDYRVQPYAPVGKLFFVHGGRQWVGSAFCIGKRSIVTAGHCLHDDGEASTKVLFSGRYAGGVNYNWPIPWHTTPAEWRELRQFSADMGVGYARASIDEKIGRAGYLPNSPKVPPWIEALGYPARPLPSYDFNGEFMWSCRGQNLGWSRNSRKMANNMTGGSSGGPWMRIMDGAYYAVGLNSHGIRGDDRFTFSPYFGDIFVGCLAWLQNQGAL